MPPTFLDTARASRPTLPMGNDLVANPLARPWTVWVLHCAEPVAPYTLGAEAVSVGREAGPGGLTLPDPSVSRLHATLAPGLGEDELVVTDAGSRNGVYVNRERVGRGRLVDGDVLRLGDAVLVVRCGAPPPEGDEGALGLLGRSPAIAELRSTIRKLAPSALPVFIAGPTGTGKELVARALHTESGRRGPFVAVNCSALPGTLVENVLFGHRRGAYTSATSDQDGAFVQADGGTLFLDEVGDLALDAQPKLLRALENGEVTPVGATQALTVAVRVVAATNVAPGAALEAGRFRHDLYARLAGVLLETPALAERKEDLVTLLRTFLAPCERPMSADFVESLLAYRWPHNVRELRLLAERLVVLHPDAPRWERGMLDGELRLPPASMSPEARPRETPPSAAPGPEKGPLPREELVGLLERCDGNVSRVAQLVGRNRKQVYRWMADYALARGTGRKGD